MRALTGSSFTGQGTSEVAWSAWHGLSRLPPVSLEDLVPEGSRAVVVAPHPDDEVLCAGGLLALLARARIAPSIVAATDGTASHPGSTEWPVGRLRSERPLESRRALRCLGGDVESVRLGLPDGGLHALSGLLADRLLALLRRSDVIFTTWRGDGHPDHEICGHICALVAGRIGARLVEIPVWAWHWAEPGDARLPWARARRLALDDEATRQKREAVQCFTSQLRTDASTGSGPILRATTVERAARPFEVMFT